MSTMSQNETSDNRKELKGEEEVSLNSCSDASLQGNIDEISNICQSMKSTKLSGTEGAIDAKDEAAGGEVKRSSEGCSGIGKWVGNSSRGTTAPMRIARGLSDLSRRPIYPNFPFSPFTSPGTSPYMTRKRQFRECQRVSVEKVGDNIQLNQYSLREPIGKGSYGIVKLAYNKEDDNYYAMKILSKKKLLQKAGVFGRVAPIRKSLGKSSGVENPLNKVYREIAILKKLDHPNVIKLVEVLDDPTEDNLYLVFELLERGEILQVPTDKPLEEKIAWKYFRDVILGLEYLHYQRIIHRDIKPSNLLIGDDDRIKIADFGVCNEFNGEDDAVLSSTSGTPAFIAPEALASLKGTYSGKLLDIWQLGVTLYSLVYGSIPFYDTNIIKLYEKIQKDEPKYPPSPMISQALKQLLQRMLEKDPSKRISLAEVKTNDWVTANGSCPLPSEQENCAVYVEVTDEDIINCVRSIPKLNTLILVKKMLKNHSFQNPFKKSIESRIAMEPSYNKKDTTNKDHTLRMNGRSNSAPCSLYCRRYSMDSCLPMVSESGGTGSEMDGPDSEHSGKSSDFSPNSQLMS